MSLALGPEVAVDESTGVAGRTGSMWPTFGSESGTGESSETIGSTALGAATAATDTLGVVGGVASPWRDMSGSAVNATGGGIVMIRIAGSGAGHGETTVRATGGPTGADQGSSTRSAAFGGAQDGRARRVGVTREPTGRDPGRGNEGTDALISTVSLTDSNGPMVDTAAMVATAHALLDPLLAEYDRALAHTDALWTDLSDDDVRWRPHDDFSPIGWHLGHQAAVAHFMVRNLTAAEPSPDPALDALMDSATPERERGGSVGGRLVLPDIERLRRYREGVADRVRFRIGNIAAGQVGAPEQLRVIACGLLTAIVNHEYQHSQWIAEVRRDHLDLASSAPPTSPLLTRLDGYTVLAP